MRYESVTVCVCVRMMSKGYHQLFKYPIYILSVPLGLSKLSLTHIMSKRTHIHILASYLPSNSWSIWVVWMSILWFSSKTFPDAKTNASFYGYLNCKEQMFCCVSKVREAKKRRLFMSLTCVLAWPCGNIAFISLSAYIWTKYPQNLLRASSPNFTGGIKWSGSHAV